MYSPLPLRVRRGILGLLATFACVIAIGNGVTYDASGLAWLTALAAAALGCWGVFRLGNPPWLYAGSRRTSARAAVPDPRLLAAMAGLAAFSLLEIALPNSWRVTDWALAFGILAAYTARPPSRPADLS